MGLHCLAETRPSALLTLAPDPGLDDKLHPHLGIVQLSQGEPGANLPPPPLAPTGPRARFHVRSLEEQEWAESQPVGGIGPVIWEALLLPEVVSGFQAAPSVCRAPLCYLPLLLPSSCV